MLPPCIHEVSLFRLQCCWAILFSFLLHLCHPEYFFVKIHFLIFDDLEQVYSLFFHLSHPEDVWFYSLHELGVGVLLLHACLLCLGELINFGNLFFQGLPLILNKFENSLIFRHLGYVLMNLSSNRLYFFQDCSCFFCFLSTCGLVVVGFILRMARIFMHQRWNQKSLPVYCMVYAMAKWP